MDDFIFDRYLGKGLRLMYHNTKSPLGTRFSHHNGEHCTLLFFWVAAGSLLCFFFRDVFEFIF